MMSTTWKINQLLSLVFGCFVWQSPAAQLQLVSPLPPHHLRQTTSSECGEMDTTWQSEDSDTVEWIQSVDGRHHHLLICNIRIKKCPGKLQKGEVQ